MFYFSKIFLKLLRMNNKFIYSLAFLLSFYLPSVLIC